MSTTASASKSSESETTPLLYRPHPATALNDSHIAWSSDPDNPHNWSAWRKWLLVAVIVPVDLSVSWCASGFSPAEGSFKEEFGVGNLIGTLGLSLYILGLAFGPMCLAPLSEDWGRSKVYIGSYGIFLLFLAATALAPSVPVFMILRLFSGIFAAVTIANFGGTIADLWPHRVTGYAMSIYLWAATCGSPSGFFLMSAVAQGYGWRTVFWALLGICGSFWLGMVLLLKETRRTAILRKRHRARARASVGNGGGGAAGREGEEGEASTAQGKVKTRQSPVLSGAAPDSVSGADSFEPRSLRSALRTGLSRPFRFLATEAIVIFGALYNGYLFGLSFLFNGVFVQVFGNGHNFSTFSVGCAFLGIAAGTSLGPLTNIWQERFYRKSFALSGESVPEARVQLAKVAALVFPASMFWFAWTTGSDVDPLVPIVASAFWGWSFYTLILMTFQYTEDSYRVYSASALAGIGFVRNIFGAAFPMFGKQLFNRLGYQWGASLLAFLAIVLVPIPFVLERYGLELRKRSPWARDHLGDDDEGGDGERAVLLS